MKKKKKKKKQQSKVNVTAPSLSRLTLGKFNTEISRF